MDDQVLLADSIICRLCAEENVNGTSLFSTTENDPDLCSTVNHYLPLKVITFYYSSFVMVYNLISYVIFPFIKAEIQILAVGITWIAFIRCINVYFYFVTLKDFYFLL